jgi:hypothetical protein
VVEEGLSPLAISSLDIWTVRTVKDKDQGERSLGKLTKLIKKYLQLRILAGLGVQPCLS